MTPEREREIREHTAEWQAAAGHHYFADDMRDLLAELDQERAAHDRARKALLLCASMAGFPDAAQACRNVIAHAQKSLAVDGGGEDKQQ